MLIQDFQPILISIECASQVQVQVFYFSKDTIRYISIAYTYSLTHFSVSDEVASREAKLIELLATYIS